MFCPKCGTENPANAKFCKTCGISLDAQPTIATSEVGQASGNQADIVQTPNTQTPVQAHTNPAGNNANAAASASGRPQGQSVSFHASSQEGAGGQYTTINVQTPATDKNNIGIAGFVLAILGVVFCWVPVLSWILWILGAIFSLIGLRKEPRGLAIAGTVITFIDLILLLVVITGCTATMGVLGAFA